MVKEIEVEKRGLKKNEVINEKDLDWKDKEKSQWKRWIQKIRNI